MYWLRKNTQNILMKSKNKPYKPAENWQGAKNRNADELTAHGHGGRPAQHGAHAAARHALIAPARRRAQGHDCQRSCPHLHLSHPAAQRLPIKQPGNASCGGLGRAAELDGLTRLLDSRWGLRNKMGSYIWKEKYTYIELETRILHGHRWWG